MNTIKFTSSAINHCKQMLKHTEKSNILFKIESGGCNGFKYILQPVNEINKKGYINEYHSGLNVTICGKSLLYVIGTKIDYKYDFMGSSFEFSNPNATSNCGCGTTFSL